MNKTNRILIILLVVQLILAGLMLLLNRPGAASEATPLLPNVTADAVSRLVIQDAEGGRLALARQGDGWMLPDAGNFPAQADAITPLLEKILAIDTARLVAETADSHGRLEVAEDTFVRRVELTTADGQTYVLFIGSAPQPRATNVRLDGQDQVYLAADLTSFDANTEASGYIDTAYFSVSPDQVVGITLENANGVLRLVKDATGAWALTDLAAGEQMDAAAVTALLNQAASIRLTEPLGLAVKPEYGMDAAQATITLTLQDGTEQTVRIGAKDEATGAYVIGSSQSPYLVLAAEFSVKDLVEKARAGFVVVPTPTPATPITPTLTAP